MALQTSLLLVLALALQSTPETASDAPSPEVEATQDRASAATGGDASTSEAAAGPPVDELAQKDRDDEIICRREAVVGSKFKKRVCATRKEWETLAERSRDTTQELQSRGTGFEPTN